MSLAAFQPKREAISVMTEKGDEHLCFVRALSLTDLAALIETNLHDLDALMMRVAQGQGNVFAPGVGDSIIVTLVKDAPEIAAQIIAMAADEPEQTENARRLPAPVQLDTLVKVFNMTFNDYGGPKKFFETAMRIYAQTKATGLISSAAPSQTTIPKVPRPARKSKTR